MYKIRGVSLKTYRSTREIQRKKKRSIAMELRTDKKTLTENEKELLAEKIQDGRAENINKSFVGRSSPVYLTITVIVLIVLFFVFIAWVIYNTS